MKIKSIILCGVVSLLLSMNSLAQLPYEVEYMYELGTFGKTGSIKEFVSFLLAEPEDEVNGALSEAWGLYLQNEPLPEGATILLDEKNGYFRYDMEFVDEYDNEGATEIYRSTVFVEMCVWNCADGMHKVFAENIGGTINGVPHDDGQYDGIIFFLYDKEKHKLNSVYDVIDYEELLSLTPDKEYEYDGEQYYVNDHRTGERKKMTPEEFNRWYEDRSVAVLSLPRTGKNIKATVYSVKGEEEREFAWDGYLFHLIK